jgi:dynein heavy chain
LSTLEKYFDALHSSSLTHIIDLLPGLMKNISMIYTLSKYYSNRDRIGSLFAKISAQMITMCKESIKEDGRPLWVQGPPLLKKLKTCIDLKNEYQRCYRIEKENLKKQKGKQFDFTELELFGKFELFCSRIQTLIELFSTIEQFKSLQQHNIEGMEGLIAQFFTYVEDLKRKASNLLDYTKNSFDKDYMAFNKKIAHLEQSLQVTINTSFENISSSEHALNLLKKFQSILLRESLQSELENKYTVIFHNYGLQLEHVQKIYERFKENPPMVRNAPPVAGNIIWCRQLMRRIEDPMMKFQQIPTIMESKESKKIIKKYNKVLRALFKFEQLWMEVWETSIEKSKDGLQATIMVKNDDRFFVNFDREILQLIREMKWLMRLGVEIPESAKMVLLQEQKFKSYNNQLWYTLREYERVVRLVKKDVAPLLAPHLEDLEKKLEPGSTMYQWTSMNIDVYLKRIHKGLFKFEELVKKVNDIIDSRIQKNLRSISKTLLVDLPYGESFSLEEFVDRQEKLVRNQAKTMNIKNIEVEKAVNDIIQTISGYCIETDSTIAVDPEEGLDMKKHFETMMLHAILSSTTQSLKMIKRRLGGRRNNQSKDSSPFFNINVELVVPNVTLNPSLDEVQEAIDKAALAVLSCSKHLKSWTYDSNNESSDNTSAIERTYHELVGKDRGVVKMVMLLTGGVHGLRTQVNDYLKEFDKYRYLWKEDKQSVYERWVKFCVDKHREEQRLQAENSADNNAKHQKPILKPTLDDFEAELKKYVSLEKEITTIDDTAIIGTLSLNTTKLQASFIEQASQWKVEYAKHLHQTAKGSLDKWLLYIDESSRKLQHEITTLEHLRLLMNILKEIREKDPLTDYKFAKIADRYVILRKYGVEVPKEEQDEVYDLPYKWEKLGKTANAVNIEIGKLQGGFKTTLVREVELFKEDVKRFRHEFETEGPMVPDIAPTEAMERLKKFQRLYQERERKYLTYKAGEELFGLQQQEYPQLTKMERELEFLQRLYTLYIDVIKNVSSYEEILWVDLDFQAITDEVNKFAAQCKKLPKQLHSWPAYKKLRKTIDDFLELQPLLEQLNDKSMRKRHWDKLQEMTGKDFKKEDDEFKLKHITEARLLDYRVDVEDICASAKKEADIEAKLNMIAEDWSKRELTFAEHGGRGFIILKGQETVELVEALEESQMMLGGIMGSRYLEPFRDKASGWMIKLTSVTETLQQWMQVQASWMYLEAVFTSGDIAKQLFQEAKKFSQIDKNWIKIMQKAYATPNVIRFCYDNEMLKTLPSLKEQLEQCQKSLSGYLEQKRDIFPRFYFSSDPDLLQILSQSSDPHSIQEHLFQIFDSISKVTFDTRQDNKIVSMHSSEGETVQFLDPVIATGNVEVWLQKLEEEMKNTMRYIIKNSSEDCRTLPLEDLINKYPAQVALLAIQFIWTIGCETALTEAKNGDRRAMGDNMKTIDLIFNELTNLTTRELKPLDRTKIETLIVIHVHQRDVFKELINTKIKDPSDFEWQKQARFYWQADTDTCMIWIADMESEYCYEYLGCKERLVITPLTDRCYITLAQAIGLKLGGAPAGPAGTGKTETVKDLGRTLGKYVVVFNCSDQMDYRAMGKIFKGLAQSGAWGDFDEFNRIELEVLSVVAQQIQCILTAMRESSKKFKFTDGRTCKLNDKTAIFITMNPGYQGRQELPENLKVQFRGVAMMVPDRYYIIRVKLSAAGYKKNDVLAKKFNVLYKLCEQQLSKQPHYDFGLRNILSVLRTAGETKRANQDKSEHFLLMRTLRDMNASKLVSEDVSLFNSLLEDLFPGLKPEKRVFDELEAQLRIEIRQTGLMEHPDWFEKVVQLYETSLVRHGIMLVGPSGSGKSACYEILLRALSVTTKKKHMQMRMNPKAITAPQMFGKLDIVQNEWTDGIFSAMWKDANKPGKKQNIWIICDGPVDAIWIENLNTVLDDNKLLTLADGARIPMSSSVKMCFEVENLNNASPATVSRAGQIYISEDVLGWSPPLQAKLMGTKSKEGTSSTPFTDSETQIVRELFEKHTGPALSFIKKELKPVMSVCPINQVITCFDLLNGVAAEHREEGKSLESAHLEKLFFFAFAWSIGGVLEGEARSQFSQYLSRLSAQVPNSESIYDAFVDSKVKQWASWKTVVPKWTYPESDALDFTTLYVPTVDSERTLYLIKKLADQRKDILLLGGSGTAKTVTVENFLYKQDPDIMVYKKINFSSATTPNIFQTTIESVIEKRFRAYGPPNGRKMIVFIDDINMPEINEWGDQVTNEIVRQLVEMKGFYSLSRIGEYIAIEDLQYIGAMSHPGGGKNDIPNRLKRHFAIFNVTLPSDNSIDQIFGSVIRGRYNSERIHDQSMVDVANNMTKATIAFWKRISEQMLPTPNKFHYIFNLRDLAKIYQGVMLCPIDVVKSARLLVSLWRHECTRVFSDRLNDIKDKEWYDSNILDIMKKYFGDELMKQNKTPTYFVNFLRDPIYDEDTDEIIEEAPKIYEPIDNITSIRPRLEQRMKEMTPSLDLVLFDSAVKHLIRISRIISMPRGNALLVGVGGSGKQSLTRLASYINRYETRQIVLHKNYNVNNLFEDLRDLYKLAGGAGKDVTFIFTDNEIKQETFLEYINSILSSGEVAGLFPKEDLDNIVNDLRDVAKREYPDTLGRDGSWDNMYRFFINRVRDKLHIVLCLSPVGEKFRTRALKFPGLISGCSVDWFFPWPEDALISVANKFLGDMKIECDDKTKDQLIKHMATVHLSMNAVAQDYFQRFRRYVYTTPRSFLSFIQLYNEIYKIKHAEIASMAHKVNVGLEKLDDAGQDVKKEEIKLKEKEVKLHIAQKQIEEMLKEIAVSTAKAEKKAREVEEVKNVLENEHAIVTQGKEEAQKDLQAAEPAMRDSENALKELTAKEINTLKGYRPSPPQLIRVIFDGVAILRHLPMQKIKMDNDKKIGNFIADSWADTKKMLADVGFLKALTQFEKDEMNDETIELLEPYLAMPAYTAEAVYAVSPPAASLCKWVRAMSVYHVTAKDVRPKIEKLRIAERKLEVASSKLKAKEEEFQAVQADLDKIQAKYNEAMARKQELQDDAERTRKFTAQANNLIAALSGERERWTQQSNQFKDLTNRLTGDVALACAFISYCGPFNSEFRTLLLNQYFYSDCSKRGIPVTKDLKVTKMFTDEAQIGEWALEGLPSDNHSIENAIMVTRSTKWPLIVDPQGQGLSWLKKREVKNELVITRLNEKMFRQKLEDCITFGKPLIIENVEEELDPMLDPVLEKNFVYSGRTKQVILQDKAVDYDDKFKLFITTKLANPHFSPELSAKTTVIDFTVTMGGLEQQLLGYVIQKEKAELEEEREKLLQDVNDNQKKIRDYEDQLLRELSDAQGNLLQNEPLIETLANTKKAAVEVKEKLNVAMETEKRINTAREDYRPVAIRGSVLYFLIVEMSLVNPMYQTSLKQFLHLFDKAITTAPQAALAKNRIENIIETCTYSIFRYISRGLFKRHKFLFVLLLACKILLRSDKLSYEAFAALLKGGAMLDVKSERPNNFSWLPDTAWLNIIALSKSLKVFESLPDMMQRNEKLWQAFYDVEKPEESKTNKIPEVNDKLNKFERLLLIRSIREDRTVLAAIEFIKDTLGEQYVESVAVELEDTWKESSNIQPLICLLSPGSDPTSMIENLAKSHKKEIFLISMGQGQEKGATELLDNGFANGTWVVLQNCHLGLNFIGTIEDKLKTSESVHPDFRLWITSEPNPKFPIGLLQMGIKITLEGDVGVKAGMKSSFSWITQELLMASKRPEWAPLLYSICFLNSIVQERRKFGPLGWNIPYEFNYADLDASLSFLQNHFASIGDDYKKGAPISWPTVNYMICEVHYGGKITDDRDRELFVTYGDLWLRPEVANLNFKFADGYTIPQAGEEKEKSKYEEFIDKLPAIDSPSVFGLNANADITYRTEESKSVLSTILDIQPKESAGSGGETREDKVKKIADNLLSRLPADFTRDQINDGIKRLGGTFKNSLNVFLRQEVDRLQILITATRKTLLELKLAIDGTIIMSPALQDALNNLHDGRVPRAWNKISWHAATLGLWFTELTGRHEQLFNWLTVDRPKSFWLAGFYNPQGFLTSVQQEVTRNKQGWALDDVILKTEVTKLEKSDISSAPEEGVYLHGLYLEGAGWDKKNCRLDEAKPKILYSELPVVYISAQTDQKKANKKSYACPVYRNKTRNDLTYIFSVDLNCEDKAFWKLRGVALLTNKDS